MIDHPTSGVDPFTPLAGWTVHPSSRGVKEREDKRAPKSEHEIARRSAELRERRRPANGSDTPPASGSHKPHHNPDIEETTP